MEQIIVGTFLHWIIELDQVPYQFTSATKTREFLENSRGHKLYLLVFQDTQGKKHIESGRNFKVKPGDPCFKLGKSIWMAGEPPENVSIGLTQALPPAGAHFGAD